MDLFDSLADFNSHEAASQSLFQAMGKSAPSPKEKNPSQAEMTLFETHISLFITDPLLNLPGSEQNSLLRELSDAVLRQASFVEKMGKRLWIRSPAVEGTLTRAIVRYERFLQMFKEHPGALLVPTLDIDLVWHTHQCSPQCYHSASINRAGRFINHDDTVKETILTDKFKETRRLYEIRFKEEYNACLCWDCEALKSELERISLDTEVDFPKLARKVELEVAYCKAVEKARRAGQKMLPILDENNRQ